MGSPSHDPYVISRVALCPTATFHTQSVKSLHDYESGCKEHADCYGHMCMTPSGYVLPPQSLAIKKGTEANEYLSSARMVFDGEPKQGMENLRRINRTKRGKMRHDILGAPINGSARLIIVPCCDYGSGYVAVPRSIASSMITPTSSRGCDKQAQASTIGERKLADGDWVIAVRPPSLTHNSAQPMRVALWDEPTLGISHDDVGLFHGDFDGDEMHIYPIYDPKSIAECESWVHEPNIPFVSARQCLQGLRQVEEAEKAGLYSFMNFTTMSMSQIAEQGRMPLYAKASRMKVDHVRQTGLRFSSPSSRGNYVSESIRGMADVTRQQLMQGSIGYMSRMAKLSSMCFIRREGSLCVVRKSGVSVLEKLSEGSFGCPCLRGVSRLCAISQQSALDSHRAGGDSMPAHDMISDLFQGLGSTVIVLPAGYKDKHPLIWSCFKDGLTVAIVAKDDIESISSWPIVGAYSPLVLRHCKDPREACSRGLSLVCNYFNVRIAKQEFHDMVAMFSYLVGESSLPITTSVGMKDRSLGWIDTLMASSYGTLKVLKSECPLSQIPCTATSAMFCGNYSMWL